MQLLTVSLSLERPSQPHCHNTARDLVLSRGVGGHFRQLDGVGGMGMPRTHRGLGTDEVGESAGTASVSLIDVRRTRPRTRERRRAYE